MSGDTVVIVGASHASVQAIDSLRREGHSGRIVLVGDEPHLPYNRPPLSKKYFSGELDRERLLLRGAEFYEQAHVETRLGLRVTAIDRSDQRLRLNDGEELRYDKLLLCIGSRPRLLEVPGYDLAGIHYLRTMADVDAIRVDLAGASKLVVVGAGYIGLEAAASARHLGLDVTVLEMADRPDEPGRRAGDFELLPAPPRTRRRAHPVQYVGVFVLGHRSGRGPCIAATGTSRPTSSSSASASCRSRRWRHPPACVVRTASGSTNIARRPTRTSYAAGDCTYQPSVRYGRRVRLESVDNAVEQARTAAANICGKAVRHEHVPWFWSDQYDIKLQIAGLTHGYDQTVMRGDPDSGRFALYYLADGELLAVDAVNSPKDFMTGKKWIGEHKHPDPVRLADPATDLKTL